MREDNFICFLELLRVLEKNDIAGRKIEDAVIALLDKSENRLNEEQKAVILAEFIDYETMRDKKMNSRRSEMETKSKTEIPMEEDYS